MSPASLDSQPAPVANDSNDAAAARFVLTRPLAMLMAAVSGASVANLYYVQPLESRLAATFHVSPAAGGLASTCTQIGYAIGLLLLVPLGDILKRRLLIVRTLLVVTVALVAVAVAPSYPLALCAMLIMGISTVAPQIILPYAAQLARPHERGNMIGIVMSGLLIGILLSRTFSGMIGTVVGWRGVYVLAAGFMLAMAALVRRFFPETEAAAEASYSELLRSVPALIRDQKVLREASVNGFFMFGAFSAFWTCLIFLLETPAYRMGAREAGLFGLIGAAGALAAPLIGKIADRKSPRFTVGVGTCLSTTAYACLLLGYRLWWLVLCVIVLDLGNQCGQVSNQARIHALGDNARNRNNMVYMFTFFLGGATGSFLGTMSWQMWGWTGVCAVGIAFLFCALSSHFFFYNPQA